MTEQLTKAEIDKLERCPKCEIRRLKVTPAGDGDVRHECLTCGYFMVWKPSTWKPGDRESKYAG